MLKIVTLNYVIESENVINTRLNDDNTLLDADIIIVSPAGLSDDWKGKCFDGSDGRKTIITKNGSDALRDNFYRRQQEINTLLDNGKIVFCLLSPVFRVLGQVEGSHSYNEITNYDWLPFNPDILTNRISKGSGTEIMLVNGAQPFAPLYHALKEDFQYEAYLKKSENDKSQFLVNKAGLTVGMSLKINEGYMVFIPNLRGSVDEAKFINNIIGCAKPILTNNIKSDPPEWANDYTLPGQEKLQGDIDSLQEEITKLENKQSKLVTELNNLIDFRGLLFEKGMPLQDVVIRSLNLIGFKAENYQEDDMEHDIVLKAPEGRAVAEVEGKDNSAINIDKLDQLSRVIDEDFHNNEEYAQGLLIGNAYRLLPLSKRQQAFTNKVRKASKRKNFNLISTQQLFFAVEKILQDPQNDLLKAAYRKIILESVGKEITFDKVAILPSETLST